MPHNFAPICGPFRRRQLTIGKQSKPRRTQPQGYFRGSSSLRNAPQ